MHFFTEPTLLNAQLPADLFGPVAGDELNKYNISSKHTVSADAKIFACQNAMMLVLPHVEDGGTVSTSLVNVVLKPIEGLDIKHSPVKYYIYRGLDKLSFITGSAITPSAGTNTEFIEKFWKNWNDFKTNTNQTGLPDPTPQSFGFDSTLTDAAKKISLLEEFYNSETSTNAFINDFQAIKVSEGEWIGTLKTSVAFEFEIIVDTDHVKMDLEYAQKHKHIVDVSASAGFEDRMKREAILNYIDPAAFYGMHYHIGAYLASYSGTTKNPPILRQEKDLVDDIVNKFLNNTAVYLDVRSEHGYSYFVYENYRNDFFTGNILSHSPTMNIKSASAANFDYLDHLAVVWPLVNLTSPPFALAPLVGGDKIDLQLRLNDNPKPLLFAENSKLFGATNVDNFKKETDLLPTPLLLPLEWSETVTLEIPHVENSGVKTNVAHHIKLQYFRQEDDSNSPNSVLKTAHYLDGTFGGIQLPSLANNIKTPFQHVLCNKRKLVNAASFAFVAENGVFQDDTRLLFYADNIFSLTTSGNDFPRFDSTTAPPDLDEIFAKKNVILSKWKIKDVTVDVDVLGIVGYNRTSLETTPEENLIMLGLLKSELAALNALAGVSELHQKYLVFEEILGTGGAALTDALSGTVFRKFKINIQGLDSNGVKQLITTSTVEVYGTKLNMLCSPAFSAATTNVPATIPDAGTFTEFDHFFRFDYDGNDSIVTALFPTGTVTLDDSGNSNSSTRPDVGLIGEMFYPVDSAGSSALSPKRPSYPLIVLSHANGGRYTDYRDLGAHLAKNGFIVSVLSSLEDRPPSQYRLYPLASFASYCTFSITIPANYFIALVGPSSFLIYNNDSGTPTSANYAFEKVTALSGTFDTSVTPQNFVVSSEDLLSLTKGTDFDIDLTGSTPTLIKYKLQTNFLNTSAVLAPQLVIVSGGTPIAFTSNYFIGIGGDLDAIYIYNNDPGAPLSSDYVFEKLTILKGTWDTSVTPNTFEVSSADLLSWVKGTDFEVVEAGGTPFLLQFKIEVGFHGLGTLGRANLIYPHLQVIKSKFGNRVEQDFGLIGHSRGGEAVVRAAREILGKPGFAIGSPGTRTGPEEEWEYVPNTLRDVKAIISLAPTDAWDSPENLTQNIPYFVLYGSMDGDVAGYRQSAAPNRNTGFSLIDRAVNDTEKSMAFVHGATHNGFITNNHDFNVNDNPSFAGNLIASSIQKNITKAYMNAFFRIFLRNESIWRPMFYGDFIPRSTQYNEIFLQYKRMVPSESDLILDFEAGGNLGTGVGKVALNAATANLREGNLIDEDIQTPHDTKGLIVTWSAADELKFNISTAGKNVTNFDYLSFRIGHVAKVSPKPPKTSWTHDGPAYTFDPSAPTTPVNYNMPPAIPLMDYDDSVNGMYSSLELLEIKLVDAASGNHKRALNQRIPEPHYREVRYNYGLTQENIPSIDDKGTPVATDDEIEHEYQNLTKSAMMTVRIPLSDFDANGVDLTKVSEVSLIFPAGTGGEIVIDDIEFTK